MRLRKFRGRWLGKLLQGPHLEPCVDVNDWSSGLWLERQFESRQVGGWNDVCLPGSLYERRPSLSELVVSDKMNCRRRGQGQFLIPGDGAGFVAKVDGQGESNAWRLREQALL
jgi:hypothetical protein